MAQAIEGQVVARLPKGRVVVMQSDGMVLFGTLHSDGLTPAFAPMPLCEIVLHARKILEGSPRALTHPLSPLVLAAAVLVLDMHVNPFSMPMLEANAAQDGGR